MKNNYCPKLENLGHLVPSDQIKVAALFQTLVALPWNTPLNKAFEIAEKALPGWFLHKGGHHIAVHRVKFDDHRVLIVAGEWVNEIIPPSRQSSVTSGIPGVEKRGFTAVAKKSDKVGRVSRSAPLHEAIKKAREEARRDAASRHKFIRSRGVVLATCDKDGEQCSPLPAAEANQWSGSFDQIKILKEVHCKNAGSIVAEIYLEGGYDGSVDDETTLNEWLKYDTECIPLTSSWKVTVWTRKDGWKF